MDEHRVLHLGKYVTFLVVALLSLSQAQHPLNISAHRAKHLAKKILKRGLGVPIDFSSMVYLLVEPSSNPARTCDPPAMPMDTLSPVPMCAFPVYIPLGVSLSAHPSYTPKSPADCPANTFYAVGYDKYPLCIFDQEWQAEDMRRTEKLLEEPDWAL